MPLHPRHSCWCFFFQRRCSVRMALVKAETKDPTPLPSTCTYPQAPGPPWHELLVLKSGTWFRMTIRLFTPSSTAKACPSTLTKTCLCPVFILALLFTARLRRRAFVVYRLGCVGGRGW